MKKSKSGSKNSAIKSGNPAFKPTKTAVKKTITGKGNTKTTSMWRGTGRSK